MIWKIKKIIQKETLTRLTSHFYKYIYIYSTLYSRYKLKFKILNFEYLLFFVICSKIYFQYTHFRYNLLKRVVFLTNLNTKCTDLQSELSDEKDISFLLRCVSPDSLWTALWISPYVPSPTRLCTSHVDDGSGRSENLITLVYWSRMANIAPHSATPQLDLEKYAAIAESWFSW